MRSWFQSDYLKLALILAFAFYLAFIPHQGYPYPVHVDEWTHWACSNELITNGGTESLTSPFSGGKPVWNQRVELGFHLFWGIFHQVTGIPWLVIIKYFPAIIFMLTILSVFLLGRREGFGWESSLLACLVPTTVGILGPGFLVPVALGMVFIPLSLFVAFNLRGIRSYLMLFIFTCFLVVTHAATAVVLAIILLPFILLNIRRDFKHSVGLTTVLVIPFVGPFPWIFRVLLFKMGSLFVPQPLPQHVSIPLSFASYGYLPCALFAVGVFSLIWKGGHKSYGLAFGAAVLLAVVLLFVELHYGVSLVYLRGFVHLQLVMGIVAGAGLWWLRRTRLSAYLASRLKPAFLSNNFGNIACLVVIVLTLALTVPARLDIPYYHMIGEKDYEAFVWIGKNVEKQYDKAILDPWKATAFTAITGRRVYSRILMAPDQKDNQAYEFLEGDCQDTRFLKKKRISIVYTRKGCDNPDLVKLRKRVYLLKSPASRSAGKH